ncbi:MAG: AAA family ATPase [Methanocorpusculum sp.]|nr:AAA family ATPase [Methanocorpusculum sp.]
MYREIVTSLLRWKESSGRKPLILKGVRQCGKTWILKEFCKNSFEDTAYFNFEGNTRLQEIFERDFDIERIIRELGDLRHTPVDTGKTAVIFDEIQFCPKAITSLKYFCETKPELAVLCAGSLLGVALAHPLSFPVGKVDFLTLHPMNFREFLLANGQQYLADHLAKSSSAEDLSPVLFDEYKDWYKDYLTVGGMPEAVLVWSKTRDLSQTDAVIDNILQGFELDFAKHAPASEYPKISAVWHEIPNQLAKENRKFTYSQVMSGGRSRLLRDAVEWLVSSGLIYRVFKIEQPAIPLSVSADESSFKIYLCDCGLLRKMSGFPPEAFVSKRKEVGLMRGAFAENFILSELQSSGVDCGHYWKSSNDAEVEFVITHGMSVIPVEVKAGERTMGKSLFVYREKFHPDFAVRFSLKKGGKVTDERGMLLSVPLFAGSVLQKFISTAEKTAKER